MNWTAFDHLESAVELIYYLHLFFVFDAPFYKPIGMSKGKMEHKINQWMEVKGGKKTICSHKIFFEKHIHWTKHC